MIAYFAAMEVKPLPQTGTNRVSTADWEVTARDFRIPQPASGVVHKWVGEPTSEERKQMDALPPPAEIVGDVVESHMDGDVRVVDKIDLKAIVIKDPGDVAAALAKSPVREFHPVPKPVAAKKARR